VTALDAYHVWELVVAKVRNVARLLLPGVPDDGVGEVVLLHAHLPTGNDVCDDVLRLRILIDSVGPLAHRDNVAALLEDLVVPGLQERFGLSLRWNVQSLWRQFRHVRVHCTQCGTVSQRGIIESTRLRVGPWLVANIGRSFVLIY